LAIPNRKLYLGVRPDSWKSCEFPSLANDLEKIGEPARLVFSAAAGLK